MSAKPVRGVVLWGQRETSGFIFLIYIYLFFISSWQTPGGVEHVINKIAIRTRREGFPIDCRVLSVLPIKWYVYFYRSKVEYPLWMYYYAVKSNFVSSHDSTQDVLSICTNYYYTEVEPFVCHILWLISMYSFRNEKSFVNK